MVAKKSKSTTRKTTTKKTTTKKSEDKILLTFRPVASAARKFIGRLQTKEFQEQNGKQVEVLVPRIEGLPMKLEVAKDEVIEVTPEQLAELEKCGFVETEEEYKARQQFVDNLDPQHPDSLTYEQLDGKGRQFMTTRQSNYVYTDKLIRV